MERIHDLCQSYANDAISLVDFHRRLEPMLGDYENVSIEDQDFINRISNELEVITFTVPAGQQKGIVLGLFPQIFDYAITKQK